MIPKRGSQKKRTRGSPDAHVSSELELPSGRPLRLVVVADTHGCPHPASAGHIRRQKPDAILHAGDIGGLEVIDALGQIARTIAVRGNVDARHSSTPDSVDLGLRVGDECLLKLVMTHIAVYGPKLRADAVRLAQSHGATAVVCGHSHVPFIGRDRGLIVFNPGSIGPRRFGLPITFGVMEVSAAGLALRHVSCETGETWTP